jgi:hypothetical protein
VRSQIEINDAALARTLVLLCALEALAQASPGTGDARALLLMLHYAYFGTVMPPRAHEARPPSPLLRYELIRSQVLLATMRAVEAELATAVGAGAPLRRACVYMAAAALPPVLARVRWWLGPGQTAVTFDNMLQDKSVAARVAVRPLG